MTTLLRRALSGPTLWTVLALASGCADTNPSLTESAAETGLDETLGMNAEEVSMSTQGPSVPAGAATEVWAIRNQWAETDTTEARRSGVAWGANSGLSWEQKYERWIAGFRRIPRTSGGETFEINTPYGDRKFAAPTLECAEVAMFLRVTFASWYGLPFYLQGWSAQDRQPIFAGHFGFVFRTGSRVRNFPLFKSAYVDHTARWTPSANWPSDSALRRMHLGTDDAVPFLTNPDGTTAGAGAYFDELFLNKRVGYFMRLILVYFGSVNLADEGNTVQVRAAGTAPGDILVKRWQRQGIGHIMPVMRVDRPAEGRIAASLASGSMPRRQPLWEDPNVAISSFTSQYTGGSEMSYDGVAYSTLGGGIRRWRTTILRAGRWTNTTLAADEPDYIAQSDQAAIGARPEQFRAIWQVITPQERQRAALDRIATARAHLRMYPASCSARTRREDAFADLYAVGEELGQTRAQVDRAHRTLEDHVFAELEYNQSKTCCWNSTTAAMATIVLDYAAREQAQAQARMTCVQPTVFRANGAGDGYDVWRAHAMTMGRAADWRAWSEDETCMARAVTMDAQTARKGDHCAR
jgi:hypothetical protein